MKAQQERLRPRDELCLRQAAGRLQVQHRWQRLLASGRRTEAREVVVGLLRRRGDDRFGGTPDGVAAPDKTGRACSAEVRREPRVAVATAIRRLDDSDPRSYGGDAIPLDGSTARMLVRRHDDAQHGLARIGVGDPRHRGGSAQDSREHGNKTRPHRPAAIGHARNMVG